jgi:uncharacterized membrane protein
VQVRQEIERVVDDVGANLSPRQRSELVTKLEGKLESYSSPYPPPPFLEAMERLVPGSAKDILAEGLKNSAHYREVELREFAIASRDQDFAQSIVSAEAGGAKRGQWLGFVAFIAIIFFAGFCLWFGYEKMAWVAFGTAVIGVVNQLISSGKLLREDRSSEKPSEPKLPKKK